MLILRKELPKLLPKQPNLAYGKDKIFVLLVGILLLMEKIVNGKLLLVKNVPAKLIPFLVLLVLAGKVHAQLLESQEVVKKLQYYMVLQLTMLNL